MKPYIKRLTPLGFALAFGLALAACDDGPAEEAGESIDNAVEEAGDAVEEATD
ncbi:MAG: hypothetical protein RIM72_14585 [Alphaproteobacteria bacterium]